MDKIKESSCDYKNGMLPECAPLGLAYVPMQPGSKPSYDPEDALKRGTLFPGLDLPFMNMVNMADVSDTPMGELMALQFVAHELHLYLDTHPDDTEAFAMLKKMLKLSDEAKRRYVERFGPLCPADLESCSRFSWLQDPWPWMYQK